MTRDKNAPPPSIELREAKVRGQKIGAHLERLYKDVASEPVPDEFLKLLEEADEKDGGSENYG